MTKNFWRFSFISLFLIICAIATETQAQTDLTGVWQGDDKATYYIRHVPRVASMMKSINGKSIDVKDDVYWFGQGKGFGNVFHGSITTGQVNQIVGEWADVPIGVPKNSGNLTLIIASKDRLILMGEPGNFGAREWKRVKLKTGKLPNQPNPSLKKGS